MNRKEAIKLMLDGKKLRLKDGDCIYYYDDHCMENPFRWCAPGNSISKPITTFWNYECWELYEKKHYYLIIYIDGKRPRVTEQKLTEDEVSCIRGSFNVKSIVKIS